MRGVPMLPADVCAMVHTAPSTPWKSRKMRLAGSGTAYGYDEAGIPRGGNDDELRSFWQASLAFGTLVVGIGVMASAEGCGPGDTRYYCDNTGCYNCDGYGCHQVTPPNPTQCTGNAQCAQNQICTDAGCVHGLQGRRGLPARRRVQRGSVHPAEHEPRQRREVHQGLRLRGRRAVRRHGLVGAVHAEEQRLHSTRASAPGEVCADGECLVDCSKGQSCPSGTQCTKGVCIPDTGTQCTSDAQCSGARRSA